MRGLPSLITYESKCVSNLAECDCLPLMLFLDMFLPVACQIVHDRLVNVTVCRASVARQSVIQHKPFWMRQRLKFVEMPLNRSMCFLLKNEPHTKHSVHQQAYEQNGTQQMSPNIDSLIMFFEQRPQYFAH